MEKDQIAKVKFELSGCFGSEQSTLIISEHNNEKFATLFTKDVGKFEVKLTTAQMDSFTVFTDRLQSIGKAGYCTTELSCAVYLKNKSFKKSDINCSWNGFYNLKKAFFGSRINN